MKVRQGSDAEFRISNWGVEGLGDGSLPDAMPEARPRLTPQSRQEAKSHPKSGMSADITLNPQVVTVAENYPEQPGALESLSPFSLLQTASSQKTLLPPAGLQHQASQLLEDQRRRFLALDQRHTQQAIARPPVLLGSFGGSGLPASFSL